MPHNIKDLGCAKCGIAAKKLLRKYLEICILGAEKVRHSRGFFQKRQNRVYAAHPWLQG